MLLEKTNQPVILYILPGGERKAPLRAGRRDGRGFSFLYRQELSFQGREGETQKGGALALLGERTRALRGLTAHVYGMKQLGRGLGNAFTNNRREFQGCFKKALNLSSLSKIRACFGSAASCATHRNSLGFLRELPLDVDSELGPCRRALGYGDDGRLALMACLGQK